MLLLLFCADLFIWTLWIFVMTPSMHFVFSIFLAVDASFFSISICINQVKAKNVRQCFAHDNDRITIAQ